MHNSTNNKGTRLSYARQKLGVGQEAMALVLGLKGNVGISKREKGQTDITYEEAKKLEDYYGLDKDWLLTGTGEMFVADWKVAEGTTIYKGNRHDTSEEKIFTRFLVEVELRGKHQGLLSKEVAAKLRISDSHWSQVKKREKNITFPMFAEAVLNLGVDANFVLAAVDSRREDMADLEKELKQLRTENSRLEMLVAFMEKERANSEPQKKSA